MKFKHSWRLYPLFLIFGVFFYFHVTGKRKRMEFYERAINEKIIDSSDWQKRTITYYLESGLEINCTPVDHWNINVGDSLVKTVNTRLFTVYKKNTESVYVRYGSFDL